MGKYMRKSKAAGDVAVMELAQSSLGVRTRAKTLALQRLQQSAASPGSYLQLRSRKLEKPPVPSGSQRQRQTGLRLGSPGPNCKTRASSRLRVSSELVEENHLPVPEESKDGDENGNDGEGDGTIEAFIGENSPDNRSTRESTPCSFIRGPDHVGTPGSATRSSSSVEISKRLQGSANRVLPAAKEMEEFFAGAELQQHRQFIEKYNFDPLKEKPLPGRYDWERFAP
uniref:Cyclin-dependent kinase inhibitor domain-containing protein n=1 Tax=Kalanchoe fedtschenkoi TaxID=63787 RepID=A0A7N0UQ57_KALFE